jgi:hypothetical protein
MFRIIRETYFHRERVKCLFSLCNNLLFDYRPSSNFQSATSSGGLWLCFFSFFVQQAYLPFFVYFHPATLLLSHFFGSDSNYFSRFFVHGSTESNIAIFILVEGDLWSVSRYGRVHQCCKINRAFLILLWISITSAQSQVEWVAGRRKHAESGLWRA